MQIAYSVWNALIFSEVLCHPAGFQKTQADQTYPKELSVRVLDCL